MIDKQIKIGLLFVVLSLLSSIHTIAQTVKLNGVKYELNYEDSSAKVIWGSKACENLVIPPNIKYKGKEFLVTSIGQAAFFYPGKYDIIIKVVLPNTIKCIERDAFRECKRIKELILSPELNHIEVGAFAGCESLEHLVLPDNLQYIGRGAFERCASLVELKLPNNLKSIGNGAFTNCINLEKIILPDQFTHIKDVFFYEPIFKGCKKIEIVEAATIEIPPHYIIFSPKLDGTYTDYLKVSSYTIQQELDKECPFWKKMKGFSKLYLQSNIYYSISEWQKKKEYETTAQYQQRVTVENRQKEIERLSIRLRNEYIEKNKPEILKGTIGTYDADYNIFPIETECGNTFVQVPMEEAQTFKQSWNNVKMNPTYGIVDNGLAILSCEFTLNGKTYQSPVSYNKQNSDVAINLPPLEISLDGGANIAENQVKPTPVTKDNSLDINIPVEANNNGNTFAVIIGNENYQHVSSVPYAKNDAKIFATYCQKTLGLPQSNVRNYENATFGTMLTALADAKAIAEAYNGDINLIFYYAGHGIPNEKDNSAYLLPIDVDGRQIEACFSLSRLYSELQSLNARSVVVFMDACFSGAQRGDGMLASARGVAIKAKSAAPQGNMVVFSAASGDETAYPYKEKGHGMFTYFLLKKLNESKGNVTLGELGDYITTQVKQQSIVVNRKSQTPTVVPSNAMGGEWREWKLK